MLMGSMRELLTRLGVCGVMVAGLAAAQTAPAPPATTIVEPPAPLLPTDARLVEGGIVGAFGSEGDRVEAILKEDGLVRRDSRGIAGPNAGSPLGWVKAYQFVDATGALAAYTFYRMDALASPEARLDQSEGVEGSREIVFLSGVSVVRIEAHTPADMLTAIRREIETGLPKVTGRKAIAPLLPSYFPADIAGTKLDPATLRYALGPVGYQSMGGVLPPEILGWDKSAEIGTASYSGHSGKGTLTLLLYPTPQIAGDRGRAIEKAINDRGAAGFGTVKMRRVGPLVGMTSGAFNPDQAEKLVQALHLNEEVTFDQKLPLEFHAEVKKTATLLESILIFTGCLIIAAVVIAVFLGGIRAGWRVMHGKPAASEPEFLTINLRDKPKALFVPKDDPRAPPPV
jgi:hypothetical protein